MKNRSRVGSTGGRGRRFEPAVIAVWMTHLRTYPWGHFVHLTFAVAPSQERSIADFKKWTRLLARWAPGGIQYFYVLIRGDENGRWHIHALTTNTKGIPSERMVRAWKHGSAQVEPFDALRGGLPYVLRQIDPDMSEFDVSPGLSQYEMDLPEREGHPEETSSAVVDSTPHAFGRDAKKPRAQIRADNKSAT